MNSNPRHSRDTSMDGLISSTVNDRYSSKPIPTSSGSRRKSFSISTFRRRKSLNASDISLAPAPHLLSPTSWNEPHHRNLPPRLQICSPADWRFIPPVSTEIPSNRKRFQTTDDISSLVDNSRGEEEVVEGYTVLDSDPEDQSEEDGRFAIRSDKATARREQRNQLRRRPEVVLHQETPGAGKEYHGPYLHVEPQKSLRRISAHIDQHQQGSQSMPPPCRQRRKLMGLGKMRAGEYSDEGH